MSSVSTELSFLKEYFERFRLLCGGPDDLLRTLIAVKDVIISASRCRNKIVLIGNGGSASIASHVAVDLTKSAGIRAVNFNEADLITCFANDYGYERWIEKAIEFYGEPGDALIAISSSGQSKNIINACHAARGRGFASIVTLSGFSPDNPLRALGDHNLWVASSVYNLIEMTHLFWLLAIVDLILEQLTTRAARTISSKE